MVSAPCAMSVALHESLKGLFALLDRERRGIAEANQVFRFALTDLFENIRFVQRQPSGYRPQTRSYDRDPLGSARKQETLDSTPRHPCPDQRLKTFRG